MRQAIHFAAACAAAIIGFSAPSLAGDDANDPLMKHYYPGAGFQREDQYEKDRFWNQHEKQVGSGRASGAESQDRDKSQSRMDGGAVTPATPPDSR